MSNIGKTVAKKQISRRTFLKGSAAGAALVGTGVVVANQGGLVSKALALVDDQPQDSGEKIYATLCRSNCFQSCFLNTHVVDGKAVKTSRRDYPEEGYSGCCLRGLSLVQRTYSPTRIKYPMRRVGERGAGQWEQISWDEALQEVADKLMETQKKYGEQSVFFDTASGGYGEIHGVKGAIGLFASAMGATRANVCYDQAMGYGTSRVIGGGVWLMGNEPADYTRSKAIFVWGSNPVYAQPQSWRWLARAQKAGAKLICIDPIFSATANKCDEYIPIVPGSDNLLVIAMLRLVIENEWFDLDYMKFKSTAPFLVRKDNGMMLRKSDFTAIADPKVDEDYYIWDAVTNSAMLAKQGGDPVLEGSFTVNGIEVQTAYSLLKVRMLSEPDVKYAAEKTGISEEKIYELADLYAHSGASSIYSNYGIDHYQNGHLWSFTLAVMAALTGNLARPGCSLGGLYVNSTTPLNNTVWAAKNGKKVRQIIPQTYVADVFRDQKLPDGTPYPLKAIFTSSSNSISNFAEQNQWFDDIIPNIDFWAVVDTEFTDTARYADIVLPCAFWLEVNDYRVSYNNPFTSLQDKAIEPLYESKPDSEIYALLAEKMGLADSVPLLDDMEWIRRRFDSPKLQALGVDFDRLMEEKTVRTATYDGSYFVRGEKGFPTPTGRAEIYCEDPKPRTDYTQDFSGVWEKERLPYFKPPNEAWAENPLHEKYPLVFIQEHSRYRTHTQWYNVPMLRELDPEPVAKMGHLEAEKRGIKTGDIVEVFNDRGHAVVKAVIDNAIAPGIISIPKGWQREQFIEGCFQEMTNRTSDVMACNFAFFDALVDVRLYKGGAN